MPSAVKLDTADNLASTTTLDEKLNNLEHIHLETASRILNIISRYRLARDPLGKISNGVNFLVQIYSKVLVRETILMCLPAFPFKSPNTSTKVLGRLPDKAEEFALAHLNGLCASIADIYTPGARLMIVSDGLVYNDLLGVPDKDVWAYGEALRALKARKDFTYIEFCRLKDIVNIDVPNQLDEIRYVANATNFRHALLQQFSRPGFNVSLRISEDEDTCLTYRGYIKFLETDLQTVYPIGEERSKTKYKRGIEYIAKQMLMRGDAFARAVRDRFPDRLRLSIHPSTGENKLSINLLPTDTAFTTPWHCAIAFRLDGTTLTGHRSDFEADDTFELVYDEHSRPSYFREKSDLLYWATEKGSIVCEPQYPAGFIIRPEAGRNTLSIRDVHADKVRALAQANSPVVLRGFAHTRDRDLFLGKAAELGVPVPWKFGSMGEVEEQSAGTRGLENVLSMHWMSFHHNGLPHAQKNGGKELGPKPPRFQFFAAVTSPPKDMERTLFSPSSLILKHVPPRLPPSSLHPLAWTVSTSSFESTVIHGLPLEISHPVTVRRRLRYQEPCARSKTRLEALHVPMDNTSTTTFPKANSGDSGNNSDLYGACEALTSLLYDRRVAYHHTWEKGDLLVSDNSLAVYSRSDFSASFDQELWRMHFH